MSTFNFIVVPPLLVPTVWPSVVQYVTPVTYVSAGDLTDESVKSDLTAGVSIAIAVLSGTTVIGLCTLQVHTFNSGLKCLYVPIIGGERIDEWGEEFFCMCKDFAKQAGCTELRGCAARGGWLRKLKQHDLNWESCYEVIKYDLTEVQQ
jgi:hypothetical protein